MKFYLYLSPSGSSHTLSDFVVVDPPELRKLKGSWECALVELSMECNFTPKRHTLYLCGDFLDVTFVNQDRIQLLRNIEIRWKYKKYLTERYLDRIYVPVIPGSKSYIRFTMVDEALQKVDFTSNKFHIVLHFKRKILWTLCRWKCE